MNPFCSTNSKNFSFVVKLYSRPSCSPGRGARVVSMMVGGERKWDGGGRLRQTGDGKAKGVGVGGEEPLEDGGFARSGGAGDDDWAMQLYC